MHTIDFYYKHPNFGKILRDLKSEFTKPDATLLADWYRFEKNIAKQFPKAGKDWLFWQFEQACLNQMLAVEETTCQLLQKKMSKSIIPDSYLRVPGIVATFHFASYRILGKWLALSRRRFMLIVSDRVKDDQEDLFYREIKSCNPDPSGFLVASANDRRLIFKIRNAISKGYHIMIYVDGNVGSRSDVLENLPFFKSPFRIQIGVERIAKMLNVPIYPIIATRTAASLGFKLLDPVFAFDTAGSSNDLGSIVGELFNILSADLQIHPYLWENWFYLDEFYS